MTNTAITKPTQRPTCSHFSSGPCAKRPGWTLNALQKAALGRSHRAKIGKDKLKLVIDETKSVLNLPSDYLVGIMPASDTGAIEAALWSLLGPRPVDLFAWESFGKEWINDCVNELKINETRTFTTSFGQLPDMSQADPTHDIVFTWNGTTSGVIVPNGDWIDDNRKGLTLCDATSAVFAVPMPWEKLDVVTFSWQKVLGGEGQHGMIVLSPRAIERLESYTPPWPIPKIFRMTKNGKLCSEIFEGSTINTPSMLCVEDMIDALAWAKQIGGTEALFNRSKSNFQTIERWVNNTPWIDFLAEEENTRSPTSVCLKAGPALLSIEKGKQTSLFKNIAALLDKEGIAFDILPYRDAPPGLRLWCGATVESRNLEALTHWLDWAYSQSLDL